MQAFPPRRKSCRTSLMLIWRSAVRPASVISPCWPSHLPRNAIRRIIDCSRCSFLAPWGLWNCDYASRGPQWSTRGRSLVRAQFRSPRAIRRVVSMTSLIASAGCWRRRPCQSKHKREWPAPEHVLRARATSGIRQEGNDGTTSLTSSRPRSGSAW